MIFVITGCSGFIGFHLSKRLLDLNNTVIGIDIMNDYYSIEQKNNNLHHLIAYKNFIFYKEDIINTKIISIHKPDFVINLAAMAGVRYSIENPEIYMRTNIEGLTHLLNECKDNNVKNIIYASSSSVYGTNKNIPFSEDDIVENQVSPYAVSKICSEKVAKLYSKLYDLKCIGLRFFTVYGPRGRPDMAPYKFLYRIMNNIEIDKYGDGETYRDYTYIDDIIDGIVGVIDNIDNLNYDIYNLGNTKTNTLNQFINYCEDITEKKAIINQMDEQIGDVKRTYSNIDRAKKDLNYNPKINLYEGLELTYKWLKNNYND